MNDPHRLDGRVAVITGAAGGLGTGIARHLAQLGARLVLLEPRLENLQALEQELQGLGVPAQTLK